MTFSYDRKMIGFLPNVQSAAAKHPRTSRVRKKGFPRPASLSYLSHRKRSPSQAASL
jgi:hypothetical protein